MLRISSVSVCIVATLACSGPLEVTGDFSHSARAALPGMQPPPDFEYFVSASGFPDGRIVIIGTFWGDLCGAEVRPRFLLEDGVASLELTFTRVVEDPICPAWVAFSEYVAGFRDLTPGVYRVHVEHDDRRYEDHHPKFDLGEVVVR